MKTIGLLGGMSWESTIPYYRIINQRVNARLGDLHSARILLYSVDFQPIEELQRSGRWDVAGMLLGNAARRLEDTGAECILLCTNTMHIVAPAIEAATTVPLLHIVDATARHILDAGLKSVALLGTRFTMEEDFYKHRLEKEFGLQVLVPELNDREIVHRTIFDELCRGMIREASQEEFRRILSQLAAQGAEGTILGCTEIGLLVSQEDSEKPLFDTTELHARAAADWALAGL